MIDALTDGIEYICVAHSGIKPMLIVLRRSMITIPCVCVFYFRCVSHDVLQVVVFVEQNLFPLSEVWPSENAGN